MNKYFCVGFFLQQLCLYSWFCHKLALEITETNTDSSQSCDISFRFRISLSFVIRILQRTI